MFIERTVPFKNGQFVESKTNEWVDLHNPATNEVVTRVPKSTQDEMLAAVESANAAFKPWYRTSFHGRQQVMFRYQNITKENMKKLAKNITLEQGKTLAGAEGDVLRGLQVVEHCCSITSLQLDETLSGIAKDMDAITYRLPRGVTAGLTPFNFPAMIPLWRRSEVFVKQVNLVVMLCFERILYILYKTIRARPWSLHDAR